VIARIRLDGEGEFEARCATDLSMGGMQLALDQELDEGRRIEIEFRLLQSRGRVESVAVVRWCRPKGEGFIVGVEFLEMDERSRDRFEQALDGIEEREKHGAVRCLSEAILDVESVEAFAGRYGGELAEGRLLVSTEESFKPGDQLLVEVRLPDGETAFRADSVVCSCKQFEEDYRVGVRFWYLDELSRQFLERTRAALAPASEVASHRGVDEEEWFDEGKRLEETPTREIPRVVVRRKLIPRHVGLGMAGIVGTAAAAMALFVVFRGPMVEGQPSTFSTERRAVPEASLLIAPEDAVVLPPRPVMAGTLEVRPIEDGRLLAVRSLSDGEELVEIIADVELAKRFNTLVLDGPPRFVIDIIGVQRAESLRSRGSVGGGIRRYRIGRHPDKVRIVLDLSKKRPVLVSQRGRSLFVTLR